jgi:alanyl aminopeptidase
MLVGRSGTLVMLFRPTISVVFLLIFSSNSFLAQAADDPQPPAFRLPATAAPQRYKVNLTVAPDKDTFSGTVDISINLRESTSVVWINAEKLNVRHASLSVNSQTLAARVIPEPKDLLGFSFDHAVGPGFAKLHVEYEGEISRKDMAGIFQVKEGGHWYIYSQFENIAARRAFPCFDEPGFKVPWQLTLNVPSGDGAFSNTPVVSEKPTAGGLKTVVFAETKPLPSYLVAIAVGPMEIVDGGHTGAKKTAVRVIVPKGHSAEAQYAAKSTADLVNLLEKYFGIPYPYEKLDSVAIPYAGYAMEHPGLVTYGATIITMKADAPLATKQISASVIAHELAHMWFGDLVTNAWWDDIWLNEGFASWMGNKVVNEYQPSWKSNVDQLNSYQTAMGTDELVSSRKVRQEILSDDDIENAFDNITYNKGSALLTMFESYVGPEKFRAGIERYLHKYSWKNATSAQFLQEVGGSDATFAKAFSSFLDQAGVPLVTAKLKCGAAAKVELSQERFLPLGSQGKLDQRWEIPVCVKYPSADSEARECTLVTNKNQSLALSKARGCPAWFDGNAGGAGYYRVSYEQSTLGALAQNEKSLTGEERVSLLGDVSAVTKGRLPMGEAMAIVPKFAADPESVVVSKTVSIVGALDDHLVPDQLRPNYRRYLSDQYKNRADSLGSKDKPDDTPDARLLRPQLFAVLANRAEDPQFIAEARKLALAWLEDHSAVDKNMLGAVLRSAAAHGDRDLFDKLHEAAKKETEEEVQETVLGAMGQFRDPEITKAALALLMTDEFDIHASLFEILGGATTWPQTRDVAYDFVKQNWDTLVAKLPTDWGAFLPYVARDYCDAQHRADAETFFTGRSTKFSGGPRDLAQSLERISLCEANKNFNQASVTEFLERY